MTAETDIHVLPECSRNKDAISRRDDRINKKIAKEMTKQDGAKVWLEKTWKLNQQT